MKKIKIKTKWAYDVLLPTLKILMRTIAPEIIKIMVEMCKKTYEHYKKVFDCEPELIEKAKEVEKFINDLERNKEEE